MASLFVRTYTFVDGTTAYGSQVEAEVGNIVTVLNNLNTAATNWGLVSVLHATSVPLVADVSSGSQHIADFKNNSVIKASISSDGTITSTKTSSQVVLGTTNTLTLSSTAPSASRVATIPDPGADCTVILSKGTPTMGAALAMGANKITGLANGTASTDAAAFGQLKILQAPVYSTTATAATSTSNTYADTNLSGSITPTSSSSRILVIVVQSVDFATTTGQSIAIQGLRLLRDGSAIFTDDRAYGLSLIANTGFNGAASRVSITYIDSPATTSAVAYKTQFNRVASGDGTVKVQTSSSPSTMILIEVA